MESSQTDICLPYSLRKYIFQTPPKNEETLWKLIKLSKFLFFQFRVLPVNTVIMTTNEINLALKHFTEEINVDISHLNFKLAITKNFEFNIERRFGYHPKLVSSILAQTHLCSLTALCLNSCVISLSEWKTLVAAQKLEKVSLAFVTVEIDEKRVASMEQILMSLPCNTLKAFIL